MAEENIKKNRRRFKGIVVNDKMAKTIIAEVTRIKVHPKYKKQYKVSKRYKIHDARGLAKVGNQVIFEECRPLSKEKKWRLIQIVK